MIHIDLKKPATQINYRDNILLIGSCFTEHIGNSLEELKFSVLQNPNGILFDPCSVSLSLTSYAENKKYTAKDFFQLNEVWHSWHHHSRYSHVDPGEVVQVANHSQQQAHEFLKKAGWLIITLGSSFSYRLTGLAARTAEMEEGSAVANCHRAPAQWFTKHLMSIDETITCISGALKKLFQLNSNLNVIFTVSPVRHTRDGIIDNNRSKARLIESVHELISEHDRVYYFPAYELVIDVLRDYRFYDIDLVHPNYMATEFVLEKFAEVCIDDAAKKLMEEIKDLSIARRHKAFQPDTQAHRQFMKTYFEKAKKLKASHPFLDLHDELNYFSQQ